MIVRMVKNVLIAILLLSAIFIANTAAQDLDKVEIQTVKAGDGIYMLVGAGGNIGVCVGEDGVFLIDDQFAPLNAKIKVAAAKLSDKPVKFLINTHWHADHTGGNELIGETGTIIVAHENVRKRLTSEQFIEFFGSKVAPLSKGGLPMVTFTDAVTFHFNNKEIEVFHVEASHTDGDAVVFFKTGNIMHTGDLLFSNGYPFIDVHNGGSVDGVIRVTGRLSDMIDDNTVLIPGHGPLSNKKGLAAFRAMLTTIKERVKSKIDAGMSLEEIIKSKPTADFDENWKGLVSPDGFVKILYDDLSK